MNEIMLDVGRLCEVTLDQHSFVTAARIVAPEALRGTFPKCRGIVQVEK